MNAVTAWMLIIFVGVPLLAVTVQFAWWCVRMVFVVLVWMIMVAGAAWPWRDSLRNGKIPATDRDEFQK